MRLALGLTVLLAGACGDDDGDDIVYVPAPPDLNAPSDEMFAVFQDVVAQDLVTVDDALAVHLTAPTEGQTVPRSPPFTFSFPPALSYRHLCSTGHFVWLRFEGLAKSLDVVGGCDRLPPFSTWTPDADTWAKFTARSGPITVTLTNATFDDEVIIEGPFRATVPTLSFTVAAE